ncbi:zinc knuckle CX2CX4HX4C containing protein, partial [Tanacetum coccineum]
MGWRYEVYTHRKAYLLEDKKIPSVGVFDEEDPSIHGVKEGGIIKDGLGGDSGPVSNVPSFAKIVQDKLVKKVVKITEMRNSEVVDGASVAIPLEVVEEVSSRFANTLYGYFIGKRLAFLLVENYVKNTWAKYGLKRIQLHEEFFLFQFDSKEDMESVMEHGPWLIPNEELKNSLVVAIPVRNGKGHTLATCPKCPKVDASTKDTDDGFVE